MSKDIGGRVLYCYGIFLRFFTALKYEDGLLRGRDNLKPIDATQTKKFYLYTWGSE